MRKKLGGRFQLSFDSLDQRIAPSGMAASPTSPPADTSSSNPSDGPTVAIGIPPSSGGGGSTTQA